MTTTKNVSMKCGKMNVYDFGTVRLHAYKTEDPIDDEAFILEKDGNAVVIELPCFKDNIEALSEYISQNGMKVDGKLVAYHAAGGTFLPDVPVYGTQSSQKYNAEGQGKGLVTNFANVFGEAFDASIPAVDKYLAEGKNVIAGIELNVKSNGEAFEIVIPEINAVYMHMLGHDCHSIVAGPAHADAIIADIEKYLDMGIEMILTSHYTVENPKDAREKIAYLKDLKIIASGCKDKETFKAKVSEKYSGYSGGNYLDMTAGFFFS